MDRSLPRPRSTRRGPPSSDVTRDHRQLTRPRVKAGAGPARASDARSAATEEVGEPVMCAGLGVCRAWGVRVGGLSLGVVRIKELTWLTNLVGFPVSLRKARGKRVGETETLNPRRASRRSCLAKFCSKKAGVERFPRCHA